MGRALIHTVRATELPVMLGAATVRPGSPHRGLDAGLLEGNSAVGVVMTDDVTSVSGTFDVLIDFTSPVATLEHVDLCVQFAKPMVIGTTGLDESQLARIADAACRIPIVLAPNTSIGVTVCLRLLQAAARAVGPDADVEIIEAHHRHKKDAPSGTALRMGQVVAETLGRDLNAVAVYGREGITGERPREAIGFSTIRAGDIVGEHTVLFGLAGERIEITHKATDRLTFARGALRAAAWVVAAGPGLYGMDDVLGFATNE